MKGEILDSMLVRLSGRKLLRFLVGSSYAPKIKIFYNLSGRFVRLLGIQSLVIRARGAFIHVLFIHLCTFKNLADSSWA